MKVVTDPGDRGVALVLTVLVMLVLMTLTGALMPLTVTETRVTANYRDAVQALYAAEAALAWMVAELRSPHVWPAALAQTHRSRFRVGSPQRSFADGSSWDLTEATIELERAGAGPQRVGRGWSWRLYAYGPLGKLLPHDPSGGHFIVGVWTSDALLHEDALVLHVAAAGPRRTRRAVQATIRWSAAGFPMVASWVIAE